MRISSVTMFEQSTASMNRQQNDFLEISKQLASGRRVVNPSDDPQASTRAVRVDQSMAVTQQYTEARVSARNSLSQSESILNSISDGIARSKTLVVQAANGTLSNADRQSVASELRGVYESLLGQANATDGNGRYLFGGYQDDAPPFVKEEGSVTYKGSEQSRSEQVDASRLMQVAETGSSIFQSVAPGAGYVAEATRTNEDGELLTGETARNEGSVVFNGPQVTNVNDPDHGDSFRIVFGEDTNENGETFSTLSVQRFDETDAEWQAFDPENNGRLTDLEYTEEGQTLSFGGLSVTLEGEPAVDDQILLAKAGSDQGAADIFKTLEETIRVLETPADGTTNQAALSNTLNTSMRDLDNALDNVLTVRASAGAKLNELDMVDAISSNRMLNYEQTLSDLVDLDYNEAISEYSLRQVGLQASQQAFADVKGMSLFDYLR